MCIKMIKFTVKVPKCVPFLYYKDGFGYIDYSSEVFSNIFFENPNKQPIKLGEGYGGSFDGQRIFMNSEMNLMFGEAIEGEKLHILFENSSKKNYFFLSSKMFISTNDTTLLYDTKQRQNIWEIKRKIGSFLFKNSGFFLTKHYDEKIKSLLCFSTQTVELLCEKDFSEICKVFVRYEDKIGQISKIYGIFEGNLVVSMTKYLLFGIDPHTGEVVWELPRTHGLLPMDNLQFNQDQNKLVYLKGNGFYEIDLASRQITRTIPLKSKMFDQLGNPFNVYMFEVWGNRLIFSGNYLGKMWTSALLGCFNMDTLEFEWVEPVPIDQGEFIGKAPVVAGNKVYLGTSEGTLFVYEMVEGV
jgi:hypothetical protein